MTNLEKYNEIFAEVFGVPNEVLNDSFGKDTVESWDSVHQLNLVALLEEAFDIMLDPEDIMGLTSYKAGKEILSNQEVEL
ncbi:MAG: acyl carrier protein [Muribaculaceae bacterium]|nr:acyl carrier protein [Muribaculaceae bacterium]